MIMVLQFSILAIWLLFPSFSVSFVCSVVPILLQIIIWNHLITKHIRWSSLYSAVSNIGPCFLLGRLPLNSVWRERYSVLKKFNNYIGQLPWSRLTATLSCNSSIYMPSCGFLYFNDWWISIKSCILSKESFHLWVLLITCILFD